MFKNRSKSTQHKYADEIENWWLDDIKTPPSDLDLKEVIPYEILNRVKQILGVGDEKREIQITEVENDSPSEDLDDDTLESIIDSNDVKCQSTSSSTKDDDHMTKNRTSAYIRFFERPHYKAMIWKENKTFTKDQMTLNQQAISVAESIAKNFVNWVGTIGGEEQSSITVERILEMFDIGITKEYSTSLKVNPKRASSVGKHKNNITKRMLKSQKISEINKSLPMKNGAKENATSSNHEKLENMETVWNGIMELKSTRDFLKFLSSNHASLELPKFVINEMRVKNK